MPWLARQLENFWLGKQKPLYRNGSSDNL